MLVTVGITYSLAEWTGTFGPRELVDDAGEGEVEGQERRRMSGCSQNIKKKCKITPNKMPATDKEAYLVVAEVQTSGESVGILLSCFVCFCFSQLHSSIHFPAQTLCSCVEGAPGFLSLHFPT